MPDRRLLEDKPDNPSDTLKWIDTSVMVADCLTKAMRDDYLMQVLKTNRWNYEQTAEAKAAKARKQAQRSQLKREKRSFKDANVSDPEHGAENHDSDPERDL